MDTAQRRNGLACGPRFARRACRNQARTITSRTIHAAPIHRATDVTKLLFHAGPWTEVKYQIRRDGESFEVPLITAPQDNPLLDRELSADHGAAVSLHRALHFRARWNAPRAMHFYVFCLSLSFFTAFITAAN